MEMHDSSMMYRIEGRIIQSMNKEILKRELIQTVYTYNLIPISLIFQYNNDHKHISKSVRRWFNL